VDKGLEEADIILPLEYRRRINTWLRLRIEVK
jgi:hypothetical protein